VFDITLCGNWSVVLFLDQVFACIYSGDLGLGRTIITSLLVAELDRQENACVFSPRINGGLRGPPLWFSFADLSNLATVFFVHLQYLDNVVGAGSPKYDQAYFEVNYLRAYTTGLTAPTPTGGINNVGPTSIPHQQNSGVSSYFQPSRLLSLGVIAGLSLLCGLW